jgi:hypothetical protein
MAAYGEIPMAAVKIPNELADVVPTDSAVRRINVGERPHIGGPLENATNGRRRGLMRQLHAKAEASTSGRPRG